MKSKVILVLALLAAVLVTIAVWQQGSDRIEDLSSRPLLDDGQLGIIGGAERIAVGRGANSVELVREGDVWGVASHAGYPAQRERIAALLHAVRGARIVEDQTANPAHHQRLGLDQSADSDNPPLSVSFAGGEQELGLLYGNEVGSGQLVRLVGNDQVWLVNRPLTMSVNSADWLALDVISIPMQQAATARWTHPDGDVLELEKSGEGEYNFRVVGLADEQQAGNERWINSMVLALINLRAQNVALRSDLALGEPELRMHVSTWEGAELEASLYDLDGRFWLLIDRFEQPQEGNLGVNADPRWAFQLGIGQVESLAKRREHIIRTQAGSEAVAE
ncbi:DUF4340 domain-containing protein [Pseudomonas sp.]|uniref:DUF4340 domain-containing protein n=1 Tax=Pseudomonas sp. TaxID=306 RepID=UPI00272CC98D|nr:DUF4340 domain-containing protein [Pseudomonas sp.]